MKSLHIGREGRSTRRIRRGRRAAMRGACGCGAAHAIEPLEARLLLSTVLYRVNAGGPALPTAPGWAADTFETPSPFTNQAASGSRPFATTAAVDVTHASVPAGTPVELFQTQRFDAADVPMEWDFPVFPGQYQVNLYFAETGAAQQVAGARKFDVSVEGAVALDDYDVFAEVGGFKGVVKSFTVASDANLDVDFGRVIQNPMVQAIEVVRIAAPNALGASAAGLDFGDVRSGDPASLTVTLTNLGLPGDPPITFDRTTITGADAASFADDFNDESLVVLNPEESTTVSLTFVPGAVGSHAAVLEVPHSGSNGPVRVALAGNGRATTANQLGGSAAAISFGDVISGQSAEQTFTLTNLGGPFDPAIVVDATTIGGTDADQFSDTFDDAGSITLAPGQSVDVAVRFAPTTVGAKAAVLDVAHGGGNGPSRVSLAGNALPVPPTNLAPTVDAGADQAVTLPAGATLAGVASDDGLPAGSTITTTWSKFSGPGAVTFGNAAQLDTTASFTADGTYVLRLTASDGTLASIDDVTVVVSPAATGGGTPVYRVEAGGAALLGPPAWEADTSSAPSPYTNAVAADSKTHSTSATIDMTHPSLPAGTLPGIFRTQRYDGGGVPMQWDFPVQPGEYTVNLYFAEVGVGQQAVGARKFDVTVEGNLALDDYDIFADAGGFRGVMKSFTVTSDTNLDVDFGRVTQNPQVQAIEILRNGPPVNLAPTANAGADQTLLLPSEATLAGTAGDDGLPDGSALTTAWSKLSGPGTVTFGDAAQLNTTAAFSEAGAYVLRLTASDGMLSGTDEMTVVVHPAGTENQAPTVDAGADQAVTLPAGASLAGTATDDGLPTASTLATTWSMVSGPGAVTFDDPAELSTTARFPVDGAYVLRLTAGDGALSSTDDVTVVVHPAPVINVVHRVNAGGAAIAGTPGWSADTTAAPSPFTNAAAAASSTHSTSATIDVSHPSIPAGTPPAVFRTQRYDGGGVPMEWDFPVDPGHFTVNLYFAEVGSGQQAVGARRFDVSIEGDLVLDNYDIFADVGGFKGVVKSFTLNSDANLEIDFGKVTQNPQVQGIEIIRNGDAVNEAPTADAGADQTVTLPSAATLAGSASDDGLPTGSTLATTWSTLSGPGTVTFGDAAQLNTTATFSAEGTYVLRLTASDGVLSDTDDVTVVVNPAAVNQAPAVDAGINQTVTMLAGPTLVNATAVSKPLAAGTIDDRAANAAGAITAAATAGTVVHRVNAGGASIDGTPGWTPDTSSAPSPYTNALAAGSKTHSTSATIDLTHPSIPAGTPPVVFRTQRYDGGDVPMLWDFPVEPGNYTVNFYFAEVGSNQQAVGARMFDVSIEGTLVLDNYDIFAEVGGFKAVVKSFTVNSDGNLDVDFAKFKQNPQVQGIEIIHNGEAANLAPTANAGADQTIALPSNATLSGSAADDGLPAGSTLTTTWSKISGPGSVTFGIPAQLNTTASFSEAGTYVLRLTASDGTLSGTDDLTVVVNPEGANNQPPVVNAGADQSITLPSNATLAGLASDDGLPAGSTLATTWSMFSGPGAVTFGNTAQLNTTASFSTAGTYVLRLTGTDGTLSSSDDVTVVVNPATTVDVGVVHRVNAGGVAVAGTPGWGGDTGSSPSPYTNAVAAGSKTHSTSAAIDLTHPSIPAGTPPTVFRTQRYDGGGTPMQWDFPVEPGNFTVNLYLAEVGSNQQAVGARMFDVSIEGNLKLDNYDIFAEVGGFKGIVKSFTLNSDANLDIDFAKFRQNPQVQAIEIIRNGGVGPNAAPVAAAGTDQNLTLPATATLAGSASDDGLPLGSTLTTTWSKLNGPGTVTFTNAAQLNTSASFSEAGTYVLRLTASDGVLTSTDDVTIVVDPPDPTNQAPVVNAGTDQAITLPSNATLAGIASDDGLPAGSTLATTWSKFSGPGTVTFGNAAQLSTTASFSAAGTYVLQLTGSDGVLSGTDDLTVVVSPENTTDVVHRVNTGGAQIAGTPAWGVDTGSSPSPFNNSALAGNNTASTGNAIDMTHASIPAGTPEAVFKSHRYDTGGTPMEWDFPVTAGFYEVRLYFAETSASQQALGARQFNVSIEGSLVLSGYDVFADVGANKGVVKTFTVNSDANLDIDFARVVQNTMIHGIEILRAQAPAALGASVSNVDFGQVIIGTTPVPTRSITLTNTASAGGANLVVDATAITGADALLFSDDFDDAGSVTLAPGQQTTLTVAFAPTSAGAKSASLAIAHSASGSPLVIPLAGTGVTEVVNQPPTVNAGPDQAITLPSSANLSGTASDDGLPPGGQLVTTWSKLSGPGTVTFANAGALTTNASFSAAGAYVLRLTATDGALTSTDDVSVTVNPGGGGTAPVSFGRSVLSGVGAAFNGPTSLQFGPDGRLYVAEQKGAIHAFTLARNGPNNYDVTSIETINLINDSPNHNDQGEVENGIQGRLLLGITLAGTVSNPVIFASHSDPRISGGSDNGDLNLDTNSGIVTRLRWDGGAWERLDLVRGLPRSEENHATNGLQYDRVANVLYVAQGGNTNMGAPSHDLAFLPEYALSAAILKIDLNQIGDTTYDIPTLDDLSRANTSGRNDINDPFGGNDGHNQAVIVAGGPVQVYSPGYRNPYDVVLTRNGRLYTIDNGSNAGWGGVPLDPGGNPTTPATAGSATNDVSEPGVTYSDQLHHIPSQGYYAGHPAPTRANRANTFNGIYPIGGSTSQSPVPVANAVEGAYRIPGVEDGALTLFPESTNGLTEYSALNFGGAMNGDLLAVSFDNKLYRVKLDASGTSVVSRTVISNSVGTVPLDVTAQGQIGPFPGTIWVADLPGDQVVIFEPNDYDGNPGGGTGAYDPNLDEDFDGYDNADEIDNGTDPLSSGDFPDDWDGDFDSDLNDPNDDNDGLPDTTDPFAIDPQNGRGNNLPVSYQWENEGTPAGGFLNLGWTGHMNNGTETYLTQFDRTKMTAGGAAGVMTVDEISEGTARGAANTQEYGLQFGANITPSTGPFYVHTRLLAPFAGLTPQPGQEMGLFFGTGDQSNYIKLVVSGDGGGSIAFAKEVGGVFNSAGTIAQALGDVDALDLYILVDPAANTARAVYTTTTNFATSAAVSVGTVQSFPAGWITAATAPAVGAISTSAGPAPAFAGTWDMMEVVPATPNQLRASASVLSYGPTLLGQPAARQVTLTNGGGPGDPDITIDGTTLAGAGAGSYADSFIDSGTVTLAPGESVTVDVTFNPPAVGSKPATLSIAHTGSGSPLVINLSGTGVVQGVLAEYYDNKDLTNLKSTRVEPDIDFVDADWGSAPPGTGVTADDVYSERFTGYVKIDTAGSWTFTADSNDGIRVWVNDVPLIDQWSNGLFNRSGVISLQPGYYPIKVEHYQDTGTVRLQLSFQGPGRSQVIIPGSHLVTDGSPVSNNNRLGVSVGTLDFGNVFVGQSPTRTLTLTNLGGTGAPNIIVDATGIGGGAAGDYGDSFNDAGNVTLAPGQSTSITVTFSPSSAGTRAASLQVVHSGSNSPLSVSLTGTGVDASTGFWTSGANMPVKLGETAAGVINGKLYVIGDGADNTLAYDIAGNTWVSNLAVRPRPGKDQIAHVINNKLYVFGGVASINNTKTALDDVQIYDPATNQWTTGADIPYPVFAAATAVINGEVYLAGGVGQNIQTIALTSKYNPATNQWTMLAPMKQGRDSAAAGTNGTKLYVFGGRTGGDSPSNGFDTVQVYDPATNTWISSLDTSGPGAALAELPQARGGIVLAPYANGEFYVIGGETVDGAGATEDNVYNRVDIYNPVTNTWRVGPSMPTARHGMSPVYHDGRIYVAGGGTHSGKSQSNLLEILQLPIV